MKVVIPVVLLGPLGFEKRLRAAAKSPVALEALRARMAKKASAAGRFASIWAAFVRACDGVAASDGGAVRAAFRSAAMCRLKDPFFSWR